jgi:hypothetical protein
LPRENPGKSMSDFAFPPSIASVPERAGALAVRIV